VREERQLLHDVAGVASLRRQVDTGRGIERDDAAGKLDAAGVRRQQAGDGLERQRLAAPDGPNSTTSRCWPRTPAQIEVAARADIDLNTLHPRRGAREHARNRKHSRGGQMTERAIGTSMDCRTRKADDREGHGLHFA
jgi:hypothetical protein